MKHKSASKVQANPTLERLRENGSWVTQKDLKARAFNKRACLFLSGSFLPTYERRLIFLKKMTARVCKPTTQTVHLRPECY
ncbi:MAG: hypothetical protein GQ532_18285 [Methylomarinum sp.]|nr:hypothetical protein [Methylomarinum sp.]